MALRAQIVSVAKNGHINQCNAVCAALDCTVVQTHTLPGPSKSDSFAKKAVLRLQASVLARAMARDIANTECDVLVYSGQIVHPIAQRLRSTYRSQRPSIFIGDPKITRRTYKVAIVSSHADSTTVDSPAADVTLRMDGVPVAPVQNSATWNGTAVLIGGANKAFNLNTSDIIGQLSDLIRKQPRLKIAFSRRTPYEIETAIRNELSKNGAIEFVTRDDRDGYLWLLRNASEFLVTPDSLTMVCESCSTSRPVHLFRLPVLNKHTSTVRFVDNFLARGHAHLIGTNDQISHVPWPGMEDIMPKLRTMLQVAVASTKR